MNFEKEHELALQQSEQSGERRLSFLGQQYPLKVIILNKQFTFFIHEYLNSELDENFFLHSSLAKVEIQKKQR